MSVIGSDTSLNATSCVFESNTAILDGGAVWVTTEARANLTGCVQHCLLCILSFSILKIPC